ncbi:MAG: GNAT family N-acetyltransferase [Bacteroidales bacterium]|nr:GNAT family N-acetyltransferase [Bacteroidales bacterium]
MNIHISESWNHILNNFSPKNRDIYFKEEYLRLYETETEKAVCCIVEKGDSKMLFPFLSRTFEYQEHTLLDFETAYGYGGPIWNNADDDFKSEALLLMSETLKNNNYVAGFVRFHPLLDNYKQFNIGRVVEDRKTVAINLALEENEIWMKEIHTKNRNVIKKGEKSGLKFVVDNDYNYLDDFIRLYNATMDKLDASDFYYFKQSYYQQFKKSLPDSFLGVVLYEGKVVSAAIFMYEGEYGHYHLAGSDVSALKLSPNNFMLWHAALELKRRGVKTFHLGGGTTSSEDDTLFCFKSRFSNSTRQFCLGKLIFNSNLYEQICLEWELNNPSKAEHYKHFLLKYKY